MARHVNIIIWARPSIYRGARVYIRARTSINATNAPINAINAINDINSINAINEINAINVFICINVSPRWR